MALDVMVGDVDVVCVDVVDGTIGDVEVVEERKRRVDVRVMCPIGHPLDKALVVAVEGESWERIVIGGLMLQCCVDDSGGVDDVEEAVGFSSKGL